ncbi:MED28 family protein [Megaselia abdita]
MASSANGNLMDEFEEAFQACLHALTKKESNTGITKDEIELEVQETTNKFIDIAHQMEVFFLQKRFLLSTKPEMLLHEENTDLKNEIIRKESLINKHYKNLDEWKKLLNQQQSYHNPQQIQMQQSQQMAGGEMWQGGPMNKPPTMQQQPNMMSPQMGGGGIPMNPVQQQMLHQQQQQQQQQMLHQQQQQQMFQIQQQNFIGGPNRSPAAGFVGQPNVSRMQSPLSYLEKTTSNIEMGGIGDGRR